MRLRLDTYSSVLLRSAGRPPAIPDSPQLEISVEKFDDIAFEANGEPIQLIQTKHHVGKTGT